MTVRNSLNYYSNPWGADEVSAYYTSRAYQANPCAQKPGENLFSWVLRAGTCAGGAGTTGIPPTDSSMPSLGSGSGTPPSPNCGGCSGSGNLFENIGCELGKLGCEGQASFAGGLMGNCIPGVPIPCIAVIGIGLVAVIGIAIGLRGR